jgi:succinate dehydrogenase / fumarate reductase cytochrome b subunit
MRNTERPLSPHISIYRWPITMTISILHRVTGVSMSVGLVVFAWWLSSVAVGGACYESFTRLMASMPGRLLLIAWSFAFFLHLANGVRHLFWDFGHGFEKKQADASAWFVLLLALVATATFWYLS